MKKGFTLAEVLITLGIIGVVAALTMPSLIVSYQKQQTVTQLKRAYSVINQAVKLASVDYEEFEFKGNSQEAAAAYLEEYFLPYLKTVQTCAPIAECGMNSQEYKYSNGSAMSDSRGVNANSTGLMLADGNVFFITPGADYYSFYIDINGKKGPNMVGRDVFRFDGDNDRQINPAKGIVFLGEGRTREELIGENCGNTNCCASAVTSGKYCAALIMADGWEIAPDYPW